ncbi:SpoIIE family protein phosphatase [Streptomyces arenae]|uniref:SpoIIE family protein phosphatase n=1 Tax=Streptomyces arenae TaxID=29301 RepID=UPI00265AD000|nr:SpoIIE family protein phosphatase [Streptomyces arenae]MCG7205137.1 SpoIIE family protein phosphatase [Streptomyces arenae]
MNADRDSAVGRLLGELSGSMVITVDERGVVTGWAPEAERLLGHAAEDIVGKAAADLFEPDFGTPYWALPRGQDSWLGELSARCQDGRPLRLSGRAYRFMDGGARSHWVLVASGARQPTPQDVERALVEWVFTESPVPLTVFDTELRCVGHNAAMTRLTGISAAERQGKTLQDLISGRDVRDWEGRLRHAIETGESAFDGEIHGHMRADPDRDRVFSASASVLRDPRGNALGLCTTVDDVTDQHRARERLALLNEASTRIGSTLDVMRTAQELADVAVPRLADWVTVDLLETMLEGDEPAPFTGTVALRRVAHQSSFPVDPRNTHQPGSVDFYPLRSPPVHCMATRRSAVRRIRDADVRSWLAEDPKRAARFERYGFQSMMGVPVQARGMTLGVTIFLRRNPEPFKDDDRLLAEELVARAAVCLDNARRFTRERTTALTLQHSLLPPGVPAQAAVVAASRYLPASGRPGLGGDWFDVIPLSGARVGLVVGDVVGHGVKAAATMGRLRAAVRTLADVDLPPDELLTHLDYLVTNLATEAEERRPGSSDLGATCVYAVYDPVSGVCSMARAGHPPPVVVTPDGAAELLDQAAGPPLGLGYLPFESADVTLAEGSMLVLYTDGLLDRAHWGNALERLLGTLAMPALSPETVCNGMLALLPDHPPDDVALLVARTRVLTSEMVAVLDVPPDPAAVGQARSWAGRRLAAWGLDDTSFVTELVVTELVTNAIRYARPPIQLRLIRDRTLICEVSDASTTAPHMRRARLLDEGGRGLLLVAQLTRRWGTRQSRNGKTIWCEQHITEGEHA